MYKLYILNGCPFCHHVLAFMDQNGIEAEILDRNEGNNLADLFHAAAKAKCLISLIPSMVWKCLSRETSLPICKNSLQIKYGVFCRL